MTIKNKLHGFLSLSAASFALLQSISASKAKPLETSSDVAGELTTSITSKTEHLVLAPAHQDELLKLYAGHRSHSSHSSHRSHYSGASSGHSSHSSHYSSANSYSSPTKSVTPSPGYNYSTPTTITRPSTTVTPTATKKTANPFAPTSTNAVATTNVIAELTPEIEQLKKKAAEGVPHAQYTLGIYHLYGTHGLQKDEARAKMLLEMSAMQGNAMAKQKLQEIDPAAAEAVSKSKQTPSASK